MLPIHQRQHSQLHDWNYRIQLGLDDPIIFSSNSGQNGISLADVMNENLDHLIGKDDPMFATYMGPTISLRILVRSPLAYLEETFLSGPDF